jgi:hypothetical protein
MNIIKYNRKQLLKLEILKRIDRVFDKRRELCIKKKAKVMKRQKEMEAAEEVEKKKAMDFIKQIEKDEEEQEE